MSKEKRKGKKQKEDPKGKFVVKRGKEENEAKLAEREDDSCTVE